MYHESVSIYEFFEKTEKEKKQKTEIIAGL